MSHGNVTILGINGHLGHAIAEAMRSAMREVGGDPKKINPLVPTDLVIDHSVQVDQFGSAAEK